jgi:predicted O-linked N-acetylglucosamine transferase (SPINDLY family)
MTHFDQLLTEATGLYHQGRYREALAAVQALLAQRPDHAAALNIAAISVQQLGDLAAAEGYFRRAIAVQPNYSDAHNNLGILLDALGRTADAIEAYRHALAHNPRSVWARVNLGRIAQREGRPDEAERAYREALAVYPNFGPALFNLGNVLRETEQMTEAEAVYARLLAHVPNHVDAHNNLGLLFGATGRLEQAEASYRTALAIDPNDANAACNLGLLLHRLGGLDEAERIYASALRAHPDHAVTWNNYGNLLADRKKFEQAGRAYAAAVARDPKYGHALGKLMLMQRMICDWSNLGAVDAQIAHLAETENDHGLGPFEMLVLPSQTAASHRRIAARYAVSLHGAALARPPLVERRARPRERLRIGYVSSDYSDHATTWLFAGVLEAHDRQHVSVHCYSTAIPVYDASRQRVIDACDHFVDLHLMSDQAAAALIVADKVDILVDLKGYTQNDRLGIQALRPAPVVVSWLGYPGTLGDARLADYVIGDAIVTPLEKAADYSEILALMPHCYQPNDRGRAIGPRPTRAEAGLPEDAFVFCNFNRSHKISPETFDLWYRLLRHVPGSVLWLLEPCPSAIDNLRREANRRGISAQQLIFAKPLPQTPHLGRLQLADFAIDTFPYTSHTTASDALWAGVPLATKIGETFASRVAASLLTNVGLPELIVTDDESYFALVCDLVDNPTKLAELRRKLARNRLTTPLFDTTRFAAYLLRLFQAIWNQEERGTRGPITIAPAAD